MNRNTCDYIPRFTFEISEDLKRRADKLLYTHGSRKAVMTPILEDILDMIEEHGQIIIGAIVDESVKPRQIIRSMCQAEKKVKGTN